MSSKIVRLGSVQDGKSQETTAHHRHDQEETAQQKREHNLLAEQGLLKGLKARTEALQPRQKGVHHRPQWPAAIRL